MQPFTVALLQMTACGNDTQANMAKGEAFCRRASAMGADLALFPEMWSAGYTSHAPCADGPDLVRAPELWGGDAAPLGAPPAEELWRGLAVRRDGPFVQRFQALARELGMAIAITYLEEWEGAPRNSVSLIDRSGAIILTYAKVHTCDFAPGEAALTPGQGFPVCELATASGAVRLGAMICYDREFPESARLLMLGGAEIILTPNACELEQHRRTQFRTRAYENMVGVAMANYAGPRMGHSLAYDPVAFDTLGSRDTLVIEAGEAEGIYLAHFDLAQIREYRRREPWGNAFRRPHRYAALCATAVEPPFVRVGPTGEPYDTARR
ncbi:carbon-nitrogen hydrolase family protein [Chloroflexia bacterium SDU3-3]|nr:carbon-nitrogen hydrolase family protein [Chloroflexia bacterium SDU3-3]